MRRFLPTIYVNPSCIHSIPCSQLETSISFGDLRRFPRKSPWNLTPQLPPKQRAAASEPLAVSSQRLHLWRWDELHWHPLTMVLDIFYQYSTNNSKAFPRYFRKFLRNFPRIFNTYRKHRVLDHPIDHPISSQPLKSSRRRLSRAVEARLSYDQVRNGAVGDHSPK